MSGMILYSLMIVAAVWFAKPVRTRAACEDWGYRVYRDSRQRVVNRICAAALFVLLFTLSALRVGTGNDYLTYIVRFHDVKTDNHVITEAGFNLVVKAVYAFLGDEYYIVVFAVFAALTVAAFVAAIYQQSRDFVLSVYLYLAFGLYFQSFNTVRYYLALGIVLYAMRPVIRKQLLRFAVLILIAALFHKTALAALLLYAAARLPWKRWMAVPAAAVAVSGFFLKDTYLALLLKVYPTYVNEAEYLNGGGISWVNIARCAAVLLFALYVYRGKEIGRESVRFYLKCNALALLLYSCFSFVPFLSRIGYYLTVSQILLIPSMLSDLPEEKKKIFRILTYAAGALYFVMFLKSASGEYVQILPYDTWMNRTGDWTSYNFIRFVP